MTPDQLFIFGILVLSLVLFLWNRWRYDLVAVFVLLLTACWGLVPASQVFSGFGHPAVITVAAVLLISRGLLNAGVVDLLARYLTRIGDRPWVQVGALSGLVAICSGFMNNVGALALFMPVAVWLARQSGRSPSFLLMPIAFASLLGGNLTLIGTPPNIIISAYRAETAGIPFGMFDFLPVGLVITVIGGLFISLVGRRLIPTRATQKNEADLFEVGSYLTELRLPEASPFVGKTLRDFQQTIEDDADAIIVALVRDGRKTTMPPAYQVLKAKDIVMVEADTENMSKIMGKTGSELVADAENKEKCELDTENLKLFEVIVTTNSILVGKSANRLELRDIYNINILAVARDGYRLKQRIDKVRFVPGDILLIQAKEENVQADLSRLGCLPLAARGLDLDRSRRVVLAASMFALALGLIALNIVPAAVGMTICALAMILTGLVKINEIYESIDMPVIVLLAAMLPIGAALESTGGSKLIADGLLSIGRTLSPAIMLSLLIGSIMLLSNVLNNAAAALLAAPVAVALAKGLAASVDPFLMAVVIGASCPFLTPIGHQSNTLVMAPGGYRFGDYWRMGLPLSILVIACAVPAILLIWPLHLAAY
ncbi:MAG: anion permease [Deltaproteobacteria bacterium]|nr:anion permease [Deltaproteobacteria bacterium]